MTSKRQAGQFREALVGQLATDGESERSAEARLRRLRGDDKASANLTPGVKLAPGVKTTSGAKTTSKPVPMAPAANLTPGVKTTLAWPESATGYTPIPHALLDCLLRLLEPAEQLIYLRLYRLIYGFPDREDALVSFETLGQSCNLSRRTVVRAVDRLIQRGLVETTSIIGGPCSSRGNRYRLIGAPKVEKPASAKMTPGANLAPMKRRRKETDEKASAADAATPDIYAIRRAALRMQGAHGVPDGGSLRGSVEAWLIGEGYHVEQSVIDEALLPLLRRE